jgi:AcrR family transcriptional regulator
MPNSTFFRLPQEKRERLVAAAWEEFTRTSFSDASINQIILRARIPRGSFYQYFTDKEDLFFYLLSSVQSYFSNLLDDILLQTGGDLFEMPFIAVEQLVASHGKQDPVLKRCLQLAQINRGMDIQQMLGNMPHCDPDDLRNKIDLSLLRCDEREFVDQLFFLLSLATATAIMDTLKQPEQLRQNLTMLKWRVDILRRGGAAPQERHARGKQFQSNARLIEINA